METDRVAVQEATPQIRAVPPPEATRGAPTVYTLTCKNLPRLRCCRRPRWAGDVRSGEGKRVPCGSARCSLECRDRWLRRLSACLLRSFQELPPTHQLRITVFGVISDPKLTQVLGRF